MGRAGEDLRRKRVKEDLSQLSSEDKLERTRLQNKTHSRRSRLRKKMYEEQLKSVSECLLTTHNRCRGGARLVIQQFGPQSQL